VLALSCRPPTRVKSDPPSFGVHEQGLPAWIGSLEIVMIDTMEAHRGPEGLGALGYSLKDISVWQRHRTTDRRRQSPISLIQRLVEGAGSPISQCQLVTIEEQTIKEVGTGHPDRAMSELISQQFPKKPIRCDRLPQVNGKQLTPKKASASSLQKQTRPSECQKPDVFIASLPPSIFFLR